MAEESNSNNNNSKGQDKKTDKNQKPKFNSNWIFAIIAISILIFQIVYGGKSAEKINTGKLKELLENHAIDKIVVVNKEMAEIYLTQDAIASGRYTDQSKNGGNGFSGPKANFTYTFGDISKFETLVSETQANAGYSEKETVYPEYVTRKNYFGEILGWILPLAFFLVLWLFLMRRMAGGGGGAGGFGA